METCKDDDKKANEFFYKDCSGLKSICMSYDEIRYELCPKTCETCPVKSPQEEKKECKDIAGTNKC